MAEININIESYGAICAHLPSDLTLLCEADCRVVDVLDQISNQYPDSAAILAKCACAIGDEMIPRSYLLDKNATLVLLSPVAGG